MGKFIEPIKRLAGKKALHNGIWLYLLQIFNTVIPLITLPYITRILGPSQYGLFSIALNLQGYYQVIVEYGFGMSATRKVALQENSEKSLRGLYSRVLASRLMLMLPCIVLTIVYTLFNYSQVDQCVCLAILTASMIGYCFQLNWLFQGMQCMRFVSIANIIGRTISVLLIFALVKSNNDLFVYCILYSITPIVVGLVSNVIAWGKFNIRYVRVTIPEVLSELKSGWFVFTTQLSSKVFGAIGLTFLGFFASSYETGIYAAIQKIPTVMLLAWSPISQVLYPISSQRIASSYGDGKAFVRRTRKWVFPPFMFIAFLIAILAKPVIAIAFGDEYADFFYWIYPLLAWVVVSINNNFLGIQTLLASGHDKEYSRCFNISVVFTALSNLGLIYLFHGDGACLAPLLSELVLWVLLIDADRKIAKGQFVSAS